MRRREPNDGMSEDVRQVQPALAAQLDITSELPGIEDFVHYCRHCSIRSAPFLAW